MHSYSYLLVYMLIVVVVYSTCNVDKFQCSTVMDYSADMPCPTILQFYN